MRNTIASVLFAAAIGLAIAPSANAQIKLERVVISPAGGHAQNAQTRFDGTAGQPVAGVAKNATTVIQYGFWTTVKSNVGVEAPAVSLSSANLQLWPNPATGRTSLTMQLAKKEWVEVMLYDEAGNFLSTLDASQHEVGSSTVALDVSSLASGTYFIAVSLPGQMLQKRITVMR